MGHLTVMKTPLNGLYLVERRPIEDDRGVFERIFCDNELKEILGEKRIIQINHSLTRLCGTIRGMHFQFPPHSEKKIVSCLRGEVWDVAVDIRHNSPTFLHWHGVVLSEKNHHAFFIPEGFAHGFQTLSSDCALLYLHTTPYVRESEGGVHALDPKIAIKWPAALCEMSPRDKNHPMLTEKFGGVAL